MMFINKMQDLNLENKRVLIRLDLNVPFKNKKILSDKKIILSIPTIKLALKKGAKIILATHLGRPVPGVFDENLSLLFIAEYLEKFLPISVRLVQNYLHNEIMFDDSKKEILLLENVRFNKGEIENDKFLSKKYASLCDIFIMDAFASAHRKHASTYGVIKFSCSCIGPLFYKEITALSMAMVNPSRPMVAVVGGSKVSTKFNVLNSLVRISDTVIVGGGIANTFIAIDNKVGKSLFEPDFISLAKNLRDKYNIPVPVDCKVCKKVSDKFISIVKNVNNICDDEEIMDFGELTIKFIFNILLKAKTILWNGPVGVFECEKFREGTKMIVEAIIKSNAFTIAGGGDTISAIELFGVTKKISYISTGGGAFLEFIEGKKLPVISILEKKSKINF